MPNMRDWDEEFWDLTGNEPPQENETGDLEGMPHLAVIDLSTVPAYAEYVEFLKRREQAEALENQVMLNNLQSKAFLQGITALSLIAGVFLSCGWTIWYWIH